MARSVIFFTSIIIYPCTMVQARVSTILLVCLLSSLFTVLTSLFEMLLKMSQSLLSRSVIHLSTLICSSQLPFCSEAVHSGKFMFQPVGSVDRIDPCICLHPYPPATPRQTADDLCKWSFHRTAVMTTGPWRHRALPARNWVTWSWSSDVISGAEERRARWGQSNR